MQDQGLVAVAHSQTVLVAQLQAEGFLFLVQRQSLFKPAPELQDQGLVAVDALQTVLVAQFQTDGFLFLMQRQSLFQPAPGLRIKAWLP